MKNLVISPAILEKLRDKHQVSRIDVQECFLNRDRTDLIDDREDHASDPPTEWFISETDKGRRLKVAYVFRDGNIYLRSCFAASAEQEKLYLSKSQAI